MGKITIGSRVAVEHDFKPGDRVRIVKEPLSTVGAVGLEATIVEVDKGSRWPLLLRFDYEDTTAYRTISTSPELTRATFNCVAPIDNNDSGPCIVCRLEGGRPMPSRAPVLHANRALAAQEAQRLSRANWGQVFAVFEFCESVEALPCYKHKWQILAAQGDLPAAAKALQNKSGISLDLAEDAVAQWVEDHTPVGLSGATP